jgi:CHAD domain-containing protein
VKHEREAVPSGYIRTAESTFRERATSLVDEARSNASSLRHNPDAEVLHELRVALRRLRSLLWAYRPLLASEFEARQQLLYRSLASAAGETRDWDILIALLSGPGKASPALLDSLTQARKQALASSRETLERARIGPTLRNTLMEAARQLDARHTQTPLAELASRQAAVAGKALQKRIKRASRAKRSDYTSFHEVRKAAKRSRYLLEFFEPVLAGKQTRVLRPLKKLQMCFGALNDVVTSQALLCANRDSLPDAAAVDEALEWLQGEQKRMTRAAARLLRKW